jgi:hypothetical protein
MKKFLSLLLALPLMLALLSCAQGKIDPFDEQTGLNESEIKDGLIRNRVKDKKAAKLEKEKEEAPIPSSSRLIMTPPPPAIGGDKTISFSVTDQVPLKDVLVELGRMAQIDVDLDPNISGGIILNAKNRPLKEVIDRIAHLGKLRYSYQNGVLHFENDSAYSKNYFVDYLTDGTLWADVENGVSSIINPGGGGSAANNNNNNRNGANTNSANNSNSANRANGANGATGVNGGNAANANNNANTNNNSGAAANSANGNAANANGGRGGQANTAGRGGQGNAAGRANNNNASAFVSSNRSAGIMSVYATEKQHEQIAKYLAEVESSVSAQVLIEAKVVEVKLSETFNTGINWAMAGTTDTLTSTNGYAAGGPLQFVTTKILASNLSASISALEKFGTTRTLSSPRIHASNNQRATINFADKLIYFTVSQTQSTASNGVGSVAVAKTTTSTKNEEKIGVQLEITPSINIKTNEITMSIRPTLSIKSDEVLDPASPTDLDGNITIKNLVPVIQSRELSTIAKIQSGNIFVIGGLMKEGTVNSNTGIPYLGRIPLLGWLFKSASKDSAVTETVIFIKATVIGSGSQVGKIDRDVQNKFDTNRRKYF